MAVPRALCIVLSLVSVTGIRRDLIDDIDNDEEAPVAAGLPSVQLPANGSLEELSKVAKWWVQAGNQVFHSPLPSMTALSQNISDYYYAFGHPSVIGRQLERHRVASWGTHHIFHLPGGASALQVQQKQTGDRRAHLSGLSHLQHGQVFSSSQPVFPLRPDYRNPLNQRQREAERATVARITASAFTNYLKKIVALPSRSFYLPSASKHAADLIEDEFRRCGITRVAQQFFTAEGQRRANVVALIPGTQYPADSVTVGAHYDGRPYQGRAPAAVDNGGGVALMLAMAKAFMEERLSPLKSVYFVAFGGEEVGLYGSKAFTDALYSGTGPPRPVSLPMRGGSHTAIIMDMVGWRSPNLPKSTVMLETKEKFAGQMAHLAHASNDYNGRDLVVTYSVSPYSSDHMNWLNRDWFAALTIDGDDSKYTCYHKRCDTESQVTPAHAVAIGKMNLGGLIRAAGVQ